MSVTSPTRAIVAGAGRAPLRRSLHPRAGNLLLEVGANKHNGEVSQFSVIRQSQNSILFQRSDPHPSGRAVGGFGQDLIDQRDTPASALAFVYDRPPHLKGGLDWSKNVNFRDTLYIDSAIYESLAAKYAGGGVTAANIVAGSWNRLAFDHSNPSDFGGFIRTIDARSDRARFYNLFDVNRNGTITEAELGQALLFNSTAGNPHSTVNYDRTFQSATGPQETASRGLSFFAQDSITFDRWTFNVGVRGERWEHFATTGENIYTFPWEFAPRSERSITTCSAMVAISCPAIIGRYYDPIRNNMTNFAGRSPAPSSKSRCTRREWIAYPHPWRPGRAGRVLLADDADAVHR